MIDLPIVEFKDVSKKFILQSQKTFKEFLPSLLRGESTHHSFLALNNVSLNLHSGTALGIIGPNGSGKSTVLKLIAKVMSPTSGKVIVRGRVSPLIELGAGFHPELTGRENIFLNATILGLSKKQIDDHYHQIVEFSELKDFIDQPIKHYSSGMYMRLAFSIAIHVQPQILLIDEILTVGDLSFQSKCYAKMEEYKRQGVSFVFVSHDLNVVRDFCHEAIYLKQGKVIFHGNTAQACQTYIQDQQPNQ